METDQRTRIMDAYDRVIPKIRDLLAEAVASAIPIENGQDIVKRFVVIMAVCQGIHSWALECVETVLDQISKEVPSTRESNERLLQSLKESRIVGD